MNLTVLRANNNFLIEGHFIFQDLVKKLKAKLEGSSAENLLQSEKSEILLRTNEKSGLTMPVFKKAKCDDTDHSSEKVRIFFLVYRLQHLILFHLYEK